MRALARLVASVAIATSVLAATAPYAVGAFYTGNELLEFCRSQNPVTAVDYVKDASCIFYIAGITDVINTRQACIASSVTAGQVRDVVVKWLKANPQERHYTAHNLVVLALSKAFPCR